jgi:predicted nucleic acid-binding protein
VDASATSASTACTCPKPGRWRSARSLVQDLAGRRYETPALDARDYESATELDRRYADLNLGLADLSVAIIARKLGTRRILTFDERHFRALRPLQGGAFTVLPADA